MPGIVGSIRIVSVSSGSIVHIGDAVNLTPRSTSKTFAGAGSFNTGDHIRTFSTASATNTWEFSGDKEKEKDGGKKSGGKGTGPGAEAGKPEAGAEGGGFGPGVWPNMEPNVPPPAPGIGTASAHADGGKGAGQIGMDHPPADYDP